MTGVDVTSRSIEIVLEVVIVILLGFDALCFAVLVDIVFADGRNSVVGVLSVLEGVVVVIEVTVGDEITLLSSTT